MRSEKGIALLVEMLIVCIVTSILMAMSVPSFTAMMRSQNQVAAHKQVSLVSQAQSEVAICSVNNTCSAAAVAPLVPAPGTMVMGGYTYVFAQNGNTWTYTATPQLGFNAGAFAYFVDQTGIVRCAPSGASVASPPC